MAEWVQHVISIVIGLLSIIGTIACYVPQIYELLAKKSTKGVSFWTYVSSTLANYYNYLSVAIVNYDTMIFWAWPNGTNPNSALAIADSATAALSLFSQFMGPLITTGVIVFVYLRETQDSASTQHGKSTSTPSDETIPILGDADSSSTMTVSVPLNESSSDEGMSTPSAMFPSKGSAVNVEIDPPTLPSPISPDESIFSRLVPSSPSTKSSLQRYAMISAYIASILLIGILFTLAMVFSTLHLYEFSLPFSRGLAIVASVQMFINWLPQIIETAFIARGKGGMSIPTLLLLIIGALATGIYMIVAREPWLNWVPYFVVASQQIFVLVLICVFESVRCCFKRKGGEVDEDGNRLSDDDIPVLIPQDS